MFYPHINRDSRRTCLFRRRRLHKNSNTVGREIVVGVYSPSYGFEKKPDENETICNKINLSGANVVFVGVGCPKQDKWIDKYRPMMPNVSIWMALGATIDFEAGKIRRAAMIWRDLYLEWFYRFLQEPMRMSHRYFVKDPIFFWYFLKQLLGMYNSPW